MGLSGWLAKTVFLSLKSASLELNISIHVVQDHLEVDCGMFVTSNYDSIFF